MSKFATLFLAALLLAPLAALRAADTPTSPTPVLDGVRRPNIVFVFADDLGYADIQCMDPASGKIKTPCCDKLASEGMIFSNMHSTCSVCSPSRYGLLAGRYNWRTYLQHDVTMGTARPMMTPERLNAASLLKQSGYKTAVIGKWHLGLNYDVKDKSDGKTATNHTRLKTGAISGGPLDLGFDYCYCYLHGLFGFPIPSDFAMLENNRIDLPAPDRKWEMAALQPDLVKRSCEWIEKNSHGPFFLYLALNTPHDPIAPAAAFKGKSGFGPYGDFVVQTDWALGEIDKQLAKNGLTENTIVIFSSDNGCSPTFIGGLAARGHLANGIFRGSKGHIWEGGHRMPFIIRWPKVVAGGTRCDQLVGLNDFIATLADLTETRMPGNSGIDSVSFLPLLKGGKEPTRTSLIHTSRNGNFAITEGPWKLILCSYSGGITYGASGSLSPEETKASAPVQLFNMADDPRERQNLWAKHPDIVQRLTVLLQKSVADGRTTPGPAEKNDVEVDVYKKHKLVAPAGGKVPEDDSDGGD